MWLVTAYHEFMKPAVSPPSLFVEFPQRRREQTFFIDDSNLHSWPLSNSQQTEKSQTTQSTAPFKFPQVTDTQSDREKSTTLLKCSDFWCYPKNILEYSDRGKDPKMDLIQHYAITSKENKSPYKDTATQFKGSSTGHCLDEDMHFSA